MNASQIVSQTASQNNAAANSGNTDIQDAGAETVQTSNSKSADTAKPDAAPGRAFNASELKTDAGHQETAITLEPETVAEGRLVDVQGQPAVGVSVRVRSLNIRSQGYEPYAKGGASLWPAQVLSIAANRSPCPRVTLVAAMQQYG